jgi:hypothetical protein
MATAHLTRNKCIALEDDNERHIHFWEQLKKALWATPGGLPLRKQGQRRQYVRITRNM